MYTIAMILGMVGYGVGVEGVEGNKVYIGTYTPSCEYGWVVTDRGIYLDTIFQKKDIDN